MRVNGRSVEDYKKFNVRETAQYNLEDPKYKWAVSNGLSPHNFLLDTSLSMYIPMYAEKGSTFVTADRYPRSCTVYGALWGPDGRTFDGDDYIDCGAFHPQGDSDKQLGVMIWFKCATGGYCITQWDCGDDSRAFDIRVINTGFTVTISDDGTVGAGHLKEYIKETDYTDNTWHLYGFSFNGNESDADEANARLKIYLDGVRLAEAGLNLAEDDNITTVYSSDAQVLLGAREDTNTAKYKIAYGVIDEVWTYDAAPTAVEFLQNYNATVFRSQ